MEKDLNQPGRMNAITTYDGGVCVDDGGVCVDLALKHRILIDPVEGLGSIERGRLNNSHISSISAASLDLGALIHYI